MYVCLNPTGQRYNYIAISHVQVKDLYNTVIIQYCTFRGRIIAKGVLKVASVPYEK